MNNFEGCLDLFIWLTCQDYDPQSKSVSSCSHRIFIYIYSLRGRPTGTSSVHTSDVAVNGDYNEAPDSPPYCTQTQDEAEPWWYVDLEDNMTSKKDEGGR